MSRLEPELKSAISLMKNELNALSAQMRLLSTDVAFLSGAYIKAKAGLQKVISEGRTL